MTSLIKFKHTRQTIKSMLTHGGRIYARKRASTDVLRACTRVNANIRDCCGSTCNIIFIIALLNTVGLKLKQEIELCVAPLVDEDNVQGLVWLLLATTGEAARSSVLILGL